MSSCGTVFKVTPLGVLTTLYNFCSQPNCADGFFPTGALVQASDGNFYGVTAGGGVNAVSGHCADGGLPNTCGTVFRITPAGVLTTLHNFCSQPSAPPPPFRCVDGADPSGPLIQASDGNLYGVAGDGAYGLGLVYRLGLDGTLTPIYNFMGNGDGAQPTPVIQASDGNLWGSAPGAKCTGADPPNCDPPGGIIKLTLSGQESVFSPGIGVLGSLLQASDGNLYGVGGDFDAGQGVIHRIGLDGTVGTLFQFPLFSHLPSGQVIQASDGNLYGTLGIAQPAAYGVVYQLTLGGTFTPIHAFMNGADGFFPESGVMEATDGNFYGTTNGNDTPAGAITPGTGYGTVFRLSPGTQPTNTVLTTSANPAASNQGVTLTASVTAQNGTPTGIVTFANGLNIMGSVPVNNGQASFAKIFPSNGSRTITASYSGDANFAGGSSTVIQGVGGLGSEVKLTTTDPSPNKGEYVTLTAAVSSPFGVPTGTATFYNGTTAIGTAYLNNGQAVIYHGFPVFGPKPISALYSGDSKFVTSRSLTLYENVGGANVFSTTTSVASSADPSSAGQSVTFTATVAASNGAMPAGSVVFLNASNTLATVPLSGGQATFSKAFPNTGNRSITALYLGEPGILGGSTSPVLSQMVTQCSTTTTLVSSMNPSAVGQMVTLTATVTPQFGGTPTGTVTFLNGTTNMGTVPLSGGTASFGKVFPVSGIKSLSAVYAGDANDTGSTGTLMQTVQ